MTTYDFTALSLTDLRVMLAEVLSDSEPSRDGEFVRALALEIGARETKEPAQ